MAQDVRPYSVYVTEDVRPHTYSRSEREEMRNAMGFPSNSAQWKDVLLRIEQAAGEYAAMCAAQEAAPKPATRAGRVDKLRHHIEMTLVGLGDEHVMNSFGEAARENNVASIDVGELNAFCLFAGKLRDRCAAAAKADRERRVRQVADKYFADLLSQIWIDETSLPAGRTGPFLKFLRAAFSPWPRRKSQHGNPMSIDELARVVGRAATGGRGRRRRRRPPGQ